METQVGVGERRKGRRKARKRKKKESRMKSGGEDSEEWTDDGGSSDGRVRRLKRGRGAALARWAQIALVDSKALKTFLTNFLLAYNIRAGVALLFRLLNLAAKKPRALMSMGLEGFAQEKNLTFRIEAMRIGLFVGSFSGIYKAVVATLKEYFSDGEEKNWHSAVGGWLAGFSLHFMDKSWHRTLGLYMATRAVQCLYNFAKLNGYWHFWGSDWKHGDALLFILSSAQIMYAYVMRPETLPPSYYKFIVRQGPIDEVMLQAVRDNCRGKPINLPQVRKYIEQTGGKEAVAAVSQTLSSATPNLIPARALHPFTKFSTVSVAKTFLDCGKLIFPVYLSLAVVPAVVLRFKNFVKAPVQVIAKCLFSAARSTAFLSVFCSGYMGIVCMQRFVLERSKGKPLDHKLWYYFAGICSSFSILLEQKSRRSELALYTFPRAADSLYMILYDHKLAFSVPQGEILLFCSAMSAVMYFYQNNPNCLSPLVAKLLDRFLPKKNHVRFAKPYKTTKPIRPNESDAESVGEQPSTIQNVPSTLSLSGGYTIVP